MNTQYRFQNGRLISIWRYTKKGQLGATGEIKKKAKEGKKATRGVKRG